MPPKKKDEGKGKGKDDKGDGQDEDQEERELVEKELVIGYLKSKLGRCRGTSGQGGVGPA